LAKINQIMKAGLLVVWQQLGLRRVTKQRTGGLEWESVVSVMIVMYGERQLLKVVLALGTPSRFPGLLDCRKQQSNEDRDDCDDDKQFD
jgi:hypothetical protein